MEGALQSLLNFNGSFVCTSALHRSMTTLTGLNNDTSNRHIDLGATRNNHDFRDLNSIQPSFDQHEPFNLTEERL